MAFVAMETPLTRQATQPSASRNCNKERDFHVRHWNGSWQVACNMKFPQRARSSQGPQDTRLHFYQRYYGTTPHQKGLTVEILPGATPCTSSTTPTSAPATYPPQDETHVAPT